MQDLVKNTYIWWNSLITACNENCRIFSDEWETDIWAKLDRKLPSFIFHKQNEGLSQRRSKTWVEAEWKLSDVHLVFLLSRDLGWHCIISFKAQVKVFMTSDTPTDVRWSEESESCGLPAWMEEVTAETRKFSAAFSKKILRAVFKVESASKAGAEIQTWLLFSLSLSLSVSYGEHLQSKPILN